MRSAWELDRDNWRLQAACRGHDPEMWNLTGVDGHLQALGDNRAAVMHELCQSDDCICPCHMPDDREPDQLEAA